MKNRTSIIPSPYCSAFATEIWEIFQRKKKINFNSLHVVSLPTYNPHSQLCASFSNHFQFNQFWFFLCSFYENQEKCDINCICKISVNNFFSLRLKCSLKVKNHMQLIQVVLWMQWNNKKKHQKQRQWQN